MDELEDILDAAVEGHAGEPALVEVARRGGSRPATGLVWSTGRVMATVARDSVRLRRRWGPVTDGRNDLRLDGGEIARLRAACREWAKRRTQWAAFFYDSLGPAGRGSRACFYQPPGKEAPTQVGCFWPGGKRGEELRGKDRVVRLATPARVRGGVTLVARIWRQGERFGPKGGSLVGVRYELTPTLVMDARRDEAFVRRRGRAGGSFYLEADEGAFLTALARRLGRKRR